MRNLKLIDVKQVLCDPVQTEAKICIDSALNRVFLGLNSKVSKISHGHQFCVDSFSPWVNENSDIIDLTFVTEHQALCAGFSNGTIYLVNTETETTDEVGCITDGISAMAWSPDQELLIVVSSQQNLLVLTKDFDIVSEKLLNPDSFGEAVPVDVGWGSKETQFHGSVGKQAAKLQAKVIQPAFSWDDQKPRISWREDGQFFATSSVDPDKGYRKIRIWNREGFLQYTSEDLDGLEQSLSWKPSGSLVASSQHLPNKHQIVFFEKNGLQHGEFHLPFETKKFYVKEIQWNVDSTILLVWGEDLVTENSNSKSYIFLYTVKNYHWYLKQSLVFDHESHGSVVAVSWDTALPLSLHILCASGKYLCYSWVWTIFRGDSVHSDSSAVVSVIDGNSVLVSVFKTAVIPPPFSTFSVTCPGFVSSISFGTGKNCNNFLAYLSDGRLLFFTQKDSIFTNSGIPESELCTVKNGATGGNGFSPRVEPYSVFGPYNIIWESKNDIPKHPLALFNWVWLSESCILCVGSTSQNQCLLLNVKLEIKGSSICLTEMSSVPVQSTVRTLTASPDGLNACLQLQNGSCLKYSIKDNSIEPWLTDTRIELQFPRPCNSVTICSVQNYPKVLGHTDRFDLYCDEKRISDCCTSFLVHEKFLLLTTHDHTLKCLLFDSDIPKILTEKGLPSLTDVSRQIERGSRLVTSVPGDGRVVLQMPRGNLESIYPRLLMLNTVSNLLDQLKFAEAFSVMKVHRINLNLIHDHNPQGFLTNCKVFVEQISSPISINLFLTELQEQDVTVSMYSAAYRHKKQPAPINYEESQYKVDTVCNSVKTALEDMDANKYLLSVITCFVKKTKPETDKALELIYSLKHSTAVNQKPKVVNADDALKYLLYLIDINKLFDVALGTYNFEIVLMVAEKSQKDPKEYVPFLNELNKLEFNYRCFRIDVHLKRYEKALLHIKKCDPNHFEECLTLIKTQRLYTNALHLYTEGSEEFKKIWTAYGEYLCQKRYFEEAGIVFMRSLEYSKALTAFEQCLNFNNAISAALKLSYSEEELKSLVVKFSNSLKLERRHKEAALLLEVYVKDLAEVINTLIEGQLWDEAFRRLHQYEFTSMIDSHLKPAVQNCSSNLVESVSKYKEQFKEYYKRLQVVREQKLKDELNEDEMPEGDVFSDAGSVSAVSTGVSRSGDSLPGSLNTMRTARNRRKQERKKYTLKEGSKHEDLALVIALKEIILSADKLHEEIGPLLKIMVLLGFEIDASELQKQFLFLLKLFEELSPKIWLEGESSSIEPLSYGPDSTSSKIAEAMLSRHFVKPVISDPELRPPPQFRKTAIWKLNMIQ